MDEKLIIISMNDEIVDSFSKEYSKLGLHFYCIHNSFQLLDVLEFEGFVFVDVEFK